MTRPAGLDLADVLDLVVGHARAVCAAQVQPQSRLSEDLHVDSLDLVEMVEAVERDLAGAGVHIRVPETELIALRTVEDLARAVWRRVPAASGGPA